MQVLISPISLAEAVAVCDGGADIVDIKNVDEGSLGANFPWVIRQIAQSLKDRPVTFSATLGDLADKPGTAALAALGAAHAGARYVKAGLYGTPTFERALAVMQAVTRACREYDPAITVVAAGYADYRRFDGLEPQVLVKVARAAGADVVMVDTAIKDGAGLFEAMTFDELHAFCASARAVGLRVALAGSVGRHHLADLRRLGADIVGVRGAVCGQGDRRTQILPEAVRRFVEAARAGELV